MSLDEQWTMVARGDVPSAKAVIPTARVTFATFGSGGDVEIPNGTAVRTADGQEFRVYKRRWWRTVIWAARDWARSIKSTLTGLLLRAVVQPANWLARRLGPDERVFHYFPARRLPWPFNGPKTRYFMVGGSHLFLNVFIDHGKMHFTYALGPESSRVQEEPSNLPDTAIGLLERAEKSSATELSRV